MIIELFREFDKIHPLSDACKYSVKCKSKERIIRRGQRLLKAGSVCTDLSFVHSGMLRGFIKRDGQEISCRFATTGDLCIVPQSYFKQTPSEETIVALTDSIIYSLPKTEVQNLYHEFPEFRTLVEKYIQINYAVCEACLFIFRSVKPHERYEWMVSTFPQIVERVQGQHFSSFVGIKADTFSRYKTAGDR